VVDLLVFGLVNFSSRRLGAGRLFTSSDGRLTDETKQTPNLATSCTKWAYLLAPIDSLLARH
jgi:hypothetical protein